MRIHKLRHAGLFIITALLAVAMAYAMVPAGFNTDGHLVPNATDGTNLANLNASSLVSGTVPAARLPNPITGQASSGASFGAGATDTIGASTTRYAYSIGQSSTAGQNVLFTVPAAMNVVGLGCFANEVAGTSTITVQQFDHSSWSSLPAICSTTSGTPYCTWTGSVAVTAGYALAVKIATGGGHSGNLYSCTVTLAP